MGFEQPGPFAVVSRAAPYGNGSEVGLALVSRLGLNSACPDSVGKLGMGYGLIEHYAIHRGIFSVRYLKAKMRNFIRGFNTAATLRVDRDHRGDPQEKANGETNAKYRLWASKLNSTGDFMS
jgi:hypothetical protein